VRELILIGMKMQPTPSDSSGSGGGGRDVGSLARHDGRELLLLLAFSLRFEQRCSPAVDLHLLSLHLDQ